MSLCSFSTSKRVLATLVRSFVSTPSNQFQEKDNLHKGDHYCQVPDRSLLELEGPDTSKFLQGLITNHMPKISPGGDGLYAAFLTPPVNRTRLHEFPFEFTYT